MSAERDLAIARAVRDSIGEGLAMTKPQRVTFCYIWGRDDDDHALRAIIAQVDASLGGEATRSLGGALAPNAPSAGASDEPSERQAAEPPSIFNRTWEEGYQYGLRSEQQRAAGILKATLDYALAVEPGDIGLDTHPGSDYDNVIKAAEQYIAETEAAQKGEG